MKTRLMAVCTALAFVWTLNAQPTTNYQVVERGANHRVIERELPGAVRDARGGTRKARILELATGMHTRRGDTWMPSNPRLSLLPDGTGATGEDLPFGLRLPADLYNEAIVVVTPGGERMVSRPAGLIYAQGTNQWVVARIKECTGELLPGGGGVIWRDAFEGVAADVVVLCSLLGLQAEVILRGELPLPEAAWGFRTAGVDGAETPLLQLWTEFFEAPEPVEEARAGEPAAGTNDVAASTRGGRPIPPPGTPPDTNLRFSAMAAMGRGTAFRIGPAEAGTNSLPVAKRWIRTTDARRFLIEQLPLPPVAGELRQLHGAVGPGAAARPMPASVVAMPVGAGMAPLPARPVSRGGASRMETASVGYAAEPGFLLDYNLLIGTVDAFTIPAGVTAHVVGAFSVHQLVLEGGSVIKFSNAPSARIILSGPLACQTSDFAPCVLTSASDQSVGEAVPGATGSPVMLAQAFIEDWSDADNTFQHLRFRYSNCGVSIPNQFRENQVWHCQFVGCGTGMAGSGQGRLAFYNCLFVDCGKAAWGSGSLVAQNVTADRCGAFADNPGSTFTSAAITNGILTGVTNLLPGIVLAATTTAATGNGIYQAVGGGEHYLSASGRGGGVANLHPALLRDLCRLTTQPPVVFSNRTLSVDTDLTPQAARGLGTPDQGYHYPPLDFALQNVELAPGRTLRVLPGTVLGTFGGAGFRQAGDSRIIIEGRPDAWNHIVRCNLVQENPLSPWTGTGASFSGDCTGASGSAGASFRFTDWSASGGDHHVLSALRPRSLAVRDCTFTGGSFSVGMPELGLTNCLFAGVGVYVGDDGSSVSYSPVIQNCTFDRGVVRLYHWEGGVWSVYNNLFHQVDFPTNDIGPVSADHNAYSGTTTRIPPAGPGDLLENVRFETGPLGRHYLPTNSALIHAGNTSATNLGLFHFTTGVDQRKAGSNLATIGYHGVALGDPATGTAWVDDGLPAGAQPWLLNDTWTWLTTPSPAAGTQFHRSALYSGIHQHYFENASTTLTLGAGDVLFVHVRLGCTNLPGELLLQWQADDSSYWHHRAYWGGDQISGWGSRTCMGPLPATNAWVRLEVAARDVDLVGRTIVGAAFTLNGGTVDWDCAGKRPLRSPADGDGDGIPDPVEDWNGNGIHDAAAGETDWATYNSANGLGTGGALRVFTPLH